MARRRETQKTKTVAWRRRAETAAPQFGRRLAGLSNAHRSVCQHQIDRGLSNLLKATDKRMKLVQDKAARPPVQLRACEA